MDLLVVAGFLGSGKTTVLLHVAKHLAAARKVAIIENEVGKVGVDDEYLKSNGLAVKEIYSGCICCSLRVDLITTLLELERDHKPDLVILEPSGVAGPKQVLQALIGYSGEISRKHVLVVIDALRFQVITDFSMPLIADGIDVANCVLLNKIDQVTPAQLENLKSRILAIRPTAKIVCISALQGTNMAGVLDEVCSSFAADSPVPIVAEFIDAPASPMPHPVIHARQFELTFALPVGQGHIEQHVANAIENITARLKNSGPCLIGHIKAMVKTDKQGLLLVTTTSYDQPPHVKGALANSVTKATLTLNAILYQADRDKISQLVDNELAALTGNLGCQVQKIH